MNKLVVSDKVLKINNENITLEDCTHIDISGNSKITIFNKDIKELNITINKNSNVLIEDFRIVDNSNNNLHVNIKEKSTLIYNHSFINKGEYNLNITTNYAEDNSKITLNIHGINDKGISSITADGILGKSVNNELLESIHIININEGKAVVIPNILVSNNDVIANHAATIGNVNTDELNYLMSKGIRYSLAHELILKGFLINNLKSLDFIMKIKEIINWR